MGVKLSAWHQVALDKESSSLLSSDAQARCTPATLPAGSDPIHFYYSFGFCESARALGNCLAENLVEQMSGAMFLMPRRECT